MKFNSREIKNQVDDIRTLARSIYDAREITGGDNAIDNAINSTINNAIENAIDNSIDNVINDVIDDVVNDLMAIVKGSHESQCSGKTASFGLSDGSYVIFDMHTTNIEGIQTITLNNLDSALAEAAEVLKEIRTYNTA